MRRLGVIMRGDADNPDEALGVLNPATTRAGWQAQACGCYFKAR